MGLVWGVRSCSISAAATGSGPDYIDRHMWGVMWVSNHPVRFCENEGIPLRFAERKIDQGRR